MRATSLTFLILLAACGDVVRAPITVVVDTDRGRALEEQGRLQELRVGVQGDRAELEKARGDLQEARRKLADLADSAATDPAAKAAAAADIRALEARLSSLAPSSSSLTREELDAALVASEQRLLASLAAELDSRAARGSPSTSIAATATPPPSTSVAAAASSSVSPAEEARALVAAAKQRLRSKKLVVADLAEGTALVERIDGALARNDALGAVEVARRLAVLADNVVVDRPLTRRKYERLNARTRDRADLQAQMVEASKAITAEDFVKANALLDAVETQLR